MGKGSPDTARRLGLLAVAAALAGGIALSGRRLARGMTLPGRGTVLPGGRRLSERFGRRKAETHTCACGTRYRVQGADRHRVYWRDGEAVLGDRCVVCDAPLPAGHDTVVI